MEESEDSRYCITLKHRALTPEFRTLIKKAAKKENMLMAEWVVYVLQERATRVITGQFEKEKIEPPALQRVEALEKGQKTIEERFALAQQIIKEHAETIQEQQERFELFAQSVQKTVLNLKAEQERGLFAKLFSRGSNSTHT